MNWHYTPYMLPLVTVAAISVGVALRAWRRRPTPGAVPLAVLMLAVAEWSLAYAFELGGLDLATIVLGLKAEYPAIVTVPVAFLALVLEYTGRARWLSHRNPSTSSGQALALLSVVPLVTLLLAWINEAHGLIWRHIELESAGPLLVATFSRGVWYWVNVAYSYTLLLLSALLLFQMFMRAPAPYRRQVGVLLAGSMLPWVGDMLWVSGLNPFAPLDPTPFAFALSGLVAAWGLFRYRLLDIVPLARDAILEEMQDGVIVLDAQGRLVDLNPAAEQMIGFPAAEAIGQPLDISDLGPFDKLRAAFRISDLEDQVFQSEIHNPKSERTFDLRISPLRDRRGHFTGRLVILHDITERVQAEEALRESKARYLDLYHNAPDLYDSLAPDGTILDINETGARMLGYSREELIGRHVTQILAPEFHDRWREEFVASQERQEPYEMEVAYRRKDGSTLWCHLRTEWVRGEAGRVLSTRGIARDITARKRAEEALKASEQRYRTLVEQSLQGLVVVQDFRIVFANEAFAEMSGYTVEELLSLSPQEVMAMVHPEDQAFVWSRFRDRLAGKPVPERYEYRGVRKDGTVQWLEMFASRIEYEGQPAIQGAIIDITERKQLEERLHHRAEELKALHETALDITARHDLPTLLQTIVQRAARLLGVSSGTLFLCDPQREAARCVVSYNTVRDYTGTVLKYGEGATGIVAQTGEPLIIDDYRTWTGRAAVYEEDQPFRAVLSVPLIWQSQVTGVIHMFRDVETRGFTQADLELLTLFAQQAAVAVENARLFEEIHWRSVHLEALNAVIMAGVAAADLTALLETTLDHTLRALGLDVGAVRLGAHSCVRSVPPAVGPAVAQIVRTARLEPNTTVAVEDWEKSDGTYAALAPVMARFGIRACLIVPVVADEQRIGHLSLADPAPRAWSAEEVSLAEAVGRELGNIAERLRLLAATQERATRMRQLALLGEELNRPLGVAEMLEVIGQSAMALSEADRVAIYLRHPDDTVTCPWSRGLSAAYLEQVTAYVQEMPGGRLLERTEPVLVPDAESLPEDSLMRSLARTEGYRATGLWPLIYEGRVVAAVGCYYDSPHVWSEAEREVMEAFCRQAAVALENARLFEETGRRADQMAIVHALAQQITPLLDVDELLQTAAEALHERFGYLSVQLYVLDREALDPSTDSGQVLEARGVAGEEGIVRRGYRQPVGQGVTGRAAERGEPVLIGDVSQEPDFIPCVPGIRSELALPIRVAGEVAGVLNIESEQLHGFDAADVVALEALAGQIGVALENAQLYTAEQARRQELDTLYELSRQLVATNDMEVITEAVARQVVQAVHVTFCRVLTLEDDGAFVCRAAYSMRFLGRDLGVGRPDPQPAQRYYQRAMADSRLQILSPGDPDLGPEERQALCLDVAQRLYLAPLRAGARVVGLLVLGEARDPTREPFDAAKQRLTAAIADQAVSALHRARLHAELEDTYVQMVLALVNAMDARDAYTAGHSQHLVKWAEALAKELGCPDDQIEIIRWAVLLHDIGKIGVPDHILRKPGPLTEEERAVIERHPEIGERIVSPVKKLAVVAPIIRAHQERWDGQGYPDGLQGEAIPLEARIVAVVDAYGAMTEDRVYRKAMSHEEAVAELRACAGTQFDPQVVEAFLRVIGQTHEVG